MTTASVAATPTQAYASHGPDKPTGLFATLKRVLSNAWSTVRSWFTRPVAGRDAGPEINAAIVSQDSQARLTCEDFKTHLSATPEPGLRHQRGLSDELPAPGDNVELAPHARDTDIPEHRSLESSVTQPCAAPKASEMKACIQSDRRDTDEAAKAHEAANILIEIVTNMVNRQPSTSDVDAHLAVRRLQAEYGKISTTQQETIRAEYEEAMKRLKSSPEVFVRHMANTMPSFFKSPFPAQS
jgi:hypothetical protein